ncbi:DUF2264 domain-containing protein [Nesterenkonia halophila]|uniref:DUF2264 domain-containing protein n=1 Tax=Nesterenkonia halophila TaxID=302044 RepID=UPI0012918A49|nr:DUF2264 domain-containing protein [Nesterenkonia halophila]
MTFAVLDTIPGSHFNLPPVNHEISPITGFTRDHWEACADGMLSAAWRWSSPRGGRLDLPGRASRNGPRSDGLEGWARTFLAAAFRVAGADGADPHGWMDRYAAGLVAGTAAPGMDDADSWPVIQGHDVFGQPLVESASVALGLRATRPWLWDRLDPAAQDRVESWLRDALIAVPAPNNWYLFPHAVAGFLESVGRGDEATARVRRRALDLLDTWHLGEGWYTDGDGGAVDHYNGWALHLYPVLDDLLAAREAGEDPRQRRSASGDRLAEHLEGFSRLFGADGAPVYMGRSMTYRFAAAASVGLGAATGNTPRSAGVSRRIISGCLRHFLDHGALDEHGLLSMGWHGPHAATLQPYSGPASPYWASKAFVSLLAPVDDPLWTAIEEPAPVEQGDRVVAVEPAGLLIQSTHDDGVVRLHNHGTDHLRVEAGEGSVMSDPLYSRQAYSTGSGPTAADNPPDNDVAVLWRGRRGERVRVNPLGAGADGRQGWAASWHRPIFGGHSPAVPGLAVISVVLARGSHELRVQRVIGCPDGAVIEAAGWARPAPPRSPGPVGSQPDDRPATPRASLVPLHGWETADEVVAPAGTAFTRRAQVTRLRAELSGSGTFVALAELDGVGASPAEVVDVVADLQVCRDEVLVRWAGEDGPIRIGLDPVTVRLPAHDRRP